MTERACAWCRRPLEQTARREQLFCGQRCRQTAFRLRRRRATAEAAAQPMRFGYADPPYPGLARKYYGDQPTYAGEVDHKALIESLEASNYAGWALSTSERALRFVLPLCPEGARVAPWVKPIGASPLTHGPHNTWEPLIVVRGRRVRPGFRDWLLAQPARGGGDLPGRKPAKFCAFLFQQLGMQPGDTLDDLFPGTGIVARAWAEMGRLSPAPRGDASQEYSGDVAEDLAHGVGAASRAALGDGLGVASSQPGRDEAFARAAGDASREYFADGGRHG